MGKQNGENISLWQKLEKSRRRLEKAFGVFLATCFFTTSSLLVNVGYANPQGGIVAAGGATIISDGATVTINQSTGKAIINWDTFNIAPNEATHFNQPSSAAIALNRINGANGASSILGKLSANGQIWLLNPAGILFGAGAQINVAGLLATTANIKNEDFLSGNYKFSQAADVNGAIVNEGHITTPDGGYVALIGTGVANSGVIKANMGKVVLAAGNTYTVDFYGDNLINFGSGSEVTRKAVNARGETLDDAVLNSGKIIANGGKVLLTARAAEKVVDSAINMSGKIEARSAVQRGGEIVLLGEGQGAVVKVSGTLNASGKKYARHGGKVYVQGAKVQLVDNASIDVSGDLGGGEVLIGGDYQGKNSSILNAQSTFVGKDVKINADALTAGSGGKVIVWADEDTRFFGGISARGGALSGDGGFVETSGHYLDVQGTVNTLAPNGATGTWLLDPTNIYIALNQTNATAAGMAGTDSSANPGNGSSPNTFSASGVVQDSLLTTGNLNNALGGTNVVVTTTNASGTGAGNITIVDPITWASTNTLTLTAAAVININNSITTGAVGSALILNAAGNVTQNASGIIGGSGGLTQSGAGTVFLSQTNTYTGTTTISAGTLQIGASGGGTTGTLGTGAVVNNAALVVNRTNAITISNDISGTGSLTDAGTGTLTLSGTNTYTGATNITAGTLKLGVANAVPSTSALSLSPSTTFDLNGLSDSIGSLASATDNTIFVTSSVAGTPTLTIGAKNTSTSFGGVIQNGNGTVAVTKNGTGTLSLTGANTYTGATAVNGPLTLSGSGTAVNTTFTINQGSTLTLDNSTTNNTDRISDTNALTLNGGEFVFKGSNTAATNASETVGSLTLPSGQSTVTTVSGSGGTTILTFASMTRSARQGLVLFRGVGQTDNAAPAAGVANIRFTTAPTTGNGQLVGGGALNSTSAPIIPFAIGDVSTSGLGTDFVTYDTGGNTTGVRLLVPLTEYLTSSSSSTPTAPTAGVNYRLTADNTTGTDATVTINSLLLSGGVTYNFDNTGSANTITVSSGNVLSTGSANVITTTGANASAIAFGSVEGKIFAASDLTFNGGTTRSINGTAGLSTGGTGTILVSNASNLLGGLTVNAGTLQGGGATIFQSQALTVRAGAAFSLTTNNSDSFTTLTLESGNTAGATVSTAGTGTLTLTAGANELTLNVNGSGATGATISGNLVVPATADAVVNDGAATSDLTISAVITGAATSYTKWNSGQLTLAGNNSTLAGTVAVTAGVLNIQNNNALGTTAAGTTVSSGAALQIDGSGLSIAEPITSLIGTGVSNGGALRNLANNNTWTGAITLGAGGAQINSDAGTLTISTGALGGATQPLTIGGSGNTSISSVIGTTTGTLTKTGSGTLTLSGANTYTGTTTIKAGTLTIGANVAASTDGPLGNAASAVLLGDTTGSNNAAFLIGGAFSMGRDITVQSGSTGTATIGSSTAAASNYTGNIALSKNAILTAISGGTATFSTGVISGTGFGLTKTDLGTVALSGVNTYTGTTTVSGGTLSITGVDGLGGSTPGTNGTSAITVANGATLDINVAGSLTNPATITLYGTGVSSGGALTFSATGSTINNPINLGSTSSIGGTGGGAGTETLAGAITTPAALNGTSVNLTANLTTAAAAIKFAAITLPTSSNLSVTTNGGSITQTGVFTIPGTSSFTAGGAAITLTQNNVFTGAVSASNTGANAITITNVGALLLGTVTSGGTVGITNTGGITTSGAITSATGGGVTLTANGGTSDITIGSNITWTSGANYALNLIATRNIIINNAINAVNGGATGSLNLTAVNSSQSITTGAGGTINVYNFNLLQGRWNQNTATLPSFTASNNFQIASSNAEFLRVTGGDGLASGTAYQIADIYGLQGIGSSSTLLSKFYKLTGNIDATGTSTWNSGAGFIPIGNATAFSGTLDGQNHTITGLTINNTTAANLGLFGVTSNVTNSTATISNLTLASVNIAGNVNTAGAGANIGGFVGKATNTLANPATFSNIHITGGSITMTVADTSGNDAIGGLIGYATGGGGSITNSDNAASVNYIAAASNPVAISIGGLIGYSEAIAISGSHNTGNVFSGASIGGSSALTSSPMVGGLIGQSGQFGHTDTQASSTISNSYNSGTVNITSTGANTNTYVGGLVGFYNTTASTGIQSSYNTGAISSTSPLDPRAGGIVGFNFGTIATSFNAGVITATRSNANSNGEGAEAGGIAGTNQGASVQGTITDSYSIGPVFISGGSGGVGRVGGLVGSNSTGVGTITTSYSTGLVTKGASGTTGGLLGVNLYNGGGTAVTSSYWDTQTSGQTTSAGGAGATGYTTAEFQGKTLANLGFGGNWATIQGDGMSANGSYPFLTALYPTPNTTPPRVISGFMPGGSASATGLGNTTVKLSYNGSIIDSAVTGANGFYYFLEGNGTVANNSPFLVYLSGAATKANVVGLTDNSTASSVLLNMSSANNIQIYGGGTAITNTNLGTAAGASPSSDVLYTVSGANLTVGNATNASANFVTSNSTINNAGTVTTSSTSYNIDGTIVGFSGTIGGLVNFTGPVTLSAGPITLNTGSNPITFSSTIDGAQALTLTSSGAKTLGGVVGSTALSSLTMNGGGTIVLNTTGITTSGAQTYTDAVILGAAPTLTSTGGDVVFASNISNGSNTLTINNAGSASQIAGVLGNGSGGLIKQGSGTLTLSAANTYTGATNINVGTLIASNATALGTTAAGTTVASGATLNISDAALGAEALSLTGTGVGGNGALTGTGTSSLTGAITLAGDTTMGVSTGGDVLTLSGAIGETGGARALTKVGSGTLKLSSANTYTGATNINGGTLAVTANNALGTTAAGTTIASGATLDLQNVAYNTTEALTINNGGILTTSTGTSSFAGTIANSGVTVNVSGTQLTLNGSMSGSGSLGFSGGTLLLNADNSSYTGAITVSGGTLSVANANGLGNGNTNTISIAGGTLNFNNIGATTVASPAKIILNNGTTLSSTGTVTVLNAIQLPFASNSIDTSSGSALTITGKINAGDLYKNGSGQLILTNTTNSYASTNILGGTLTVTQNNQLGASTAPITLSGGTLEAAGTFTLGTSRNLTLTNAGGGGTIQVDPGFTLTYGGVIAGTNAADSLIKSGGGTLTLSGANTYIGATNIKEGTLLVGANTPSGSAGPLGNATSAVLLGDTTGSNNAALLIGGAFTIGRNVTVQAGSSGTATLGGSTAANSVFTGNITLNKNATLTAVNGGTSTFSTGVISGSGFGITKTDLGTVALSSANTYSGGTTLSAGTLQLGIGSTGAITNGPVGTGTLALNGGTLTSSGSFSIANNYTVGGSAAIGGSNNLTLSGTGTLNSGTLTVSNTGTTTLSGNLSGAGALTEDTSGGSSTLIISGADNSSFSGATTLTNGTLQINVASNALGSGSLALNGGTLLSMLTASLGNNYTVGGTAAIGGSNNLTLSGTGVLNALLTNTNTVTTTLSGAISGASGITQNSSGALVLSHANTYNGTTTLSTGTLEADSNTALGSGSLVLNGGTLKTTVGGTNLANGFTVGGSGVSIDGVANLVLSGDGVLNALLANSNTATTTLSGAISGASGITQNSSGVLVLSHANTYTGATNINAGTLAVTTNDALGTTAAGTTIASGATLDLQGVTYSTTEALAINDIGTLLNSTGASSFAGAITLSGNNTIQVGTSAGLTLSGAIGGSSTSLAVNGDATSSTLTLSGNNNFTTAVTINGGILNVASATALGNASTINILSTNNNATLQFNNVASTNSGTVLLQTNGTLSGVGTASSSNTIQLGTSPTSILVNAGGDTLTLSGVLNSGSLSKNGSGTLVLTNISNSYTGTTNINAGTLAVTVDRALGTTAGGTNIASGATLDFRNVTYNRTEAVTINGGTLATSTGTSSFAGAITLGASSSAINVAGTQLTLSGVITDGASSFDITKSGVGRLILSNANTYDNGTTISNGVVEVQNTVALGTGAVSVSSGATLQVDTGLNVGNAITLNNTGFSGTNGALVGKGTTTVSGAITLGSSSTIGTFGSGTDALTLQTGDISNSSNTVTFNTAAAGDTILESGVIGNGSGGVTKIGSGTLTLGGVNTYSGTTNINVGILKVSQDSNLGAASAPIAFGGGTLQSTASFTLTTGRGVTLNSGGGTFSPDSATVLTYGGLISGSNALAMSGLGTLVLSGANSGFSGTTTISNGTLEIQTNNNVLGSNAITVSSGTLQVDTGRNIANAITLNGTGAAGSNGVLVGQGTTTVSGPITLASNSTIGTNTGSDAFTLSGAIGETGGARALTKAGSGAVILSGINTYSGATAINAGTLRLNAATGLGSTSGTTVANNAVLNINFNGALTTNPITLNGAGSGSGALTFSGANNTLNADINLASSSTIGGSGTGTITFNNPISGTAVNLTINLASASAVALPAVSLNTSGNLNVTSGGTISQKSATALNIAGGTLTTNSAGDTTLLNTGNDFATVLLTGNNVAIFDTNSIALGASTISGTLDVTANGGAITNSGALAVTGAATFTAGSNDITLNNGGNDFSSIGIVSGRDVQITDSNALVLNDMAVTGNLGVTTGGAITQQTSTSITVNGVGKVATFNAGSNDITLDKNNDFASVAISSGNNVSITDANALILGASTVQNNFTVNTTGHITQNGTITVNGTGPNKITTLSAGSGGDITLNDINNDFSTVTISTTRSAVLHDANDLTLGPITTSSNFTAVADGSLTTTRLIQTGLGNVDLTTTGSGTITIGGPVAEGITTTSGGAITITAENTNNLTSGVFVNANLTTVGISPAQATIGSGVSVGSGVHITQDGGAINVEGHGNFTVIQAQTYTTSQNLLFANTDVFFEGATTSADGVNLSFATTGSGGIRVESNSSIDSGGTLTLSGIDLLANPGISIELQSNSFVRAKNALVLQGSTGNSDIVLNGSVETTGTNQAVTINAAGTGVTQLGSSITTKSSAINLPDAITLINDATLSTVGSSGTGANISVATAITGPSNKLTLAAGAGDITLNNSNNDFGTVQVNSGAAVQLRDLNDLTLDNITATGALDVTTGGLLTVTDDITTAGVSLASVGLTQSAGTIDAGGDAILIDAGADAVNLAGSLTTTNASASAITIQNATTVALGNLTASSGTVKLGIGQNITGTVTQNTGTAINAGVLTASTAGAITLDKNNQLSTLGAIMRGGDLLVNDTTGGLDVTGAITGGTISNSVTLTTAGGALVLNGNISTSGANNISLSGAGVTQSGSETVNAGAGTITINGGGGAINLSGLLTTTNATTSAVTIRNATTTALGNITANSGTVNLGVGQDITGALTQNASKAISASNLIVSTAGSITLNSATNTISNLGAVTRGGAFTLDNSAALTVNGPITAGTITNSVTIDSTFGSGGLLTLAGNISTSGANNISLSGVGVTQSAGTVNASSGTITINGGAGAIIQNAAAIIHADILAANGANSITLAGTNNIINKLGNIAAAGQTVSLVDTVDLLQASSTNVVADVLTVDDSAAAITLNNATNDVATLNLSGTALSYTDANGFAVGTIQSAGVINLTAGGAITETGAITGGLLTTSSASGTSLNQSGNAVTSFHATNTTSNDIVLINTAAPLTITGISQSGGGNINISNAGGMVVNGAINSGTGTTTLAATAGTNSDITLNSTITANNSGDAIVLAANRNFINNVDENVLQAGSGRWLVYSTNPASDTFGPAGHILASGNVAIWNKSYPSAVSQTGNRYIFSYSPTLTFTSTNASKTYGDAAIDLSSNYTTSALQTNTYSGAIVADTLNAVVSGAPSISSTGNNTTATVTTPGPDYAINIAQGTLSSLTGYTLAYSSTGLLTITPRPINITGTKVYNATTSFAGNQLTAGNLVNGDTVTLGGSATVSSKNVATYTSFASNSLTSSNSNYAVTGGTVSVTITPATLTYNADPASMVYGNSVPSLSGTVTGFAGSDNLSNATTGTAAFNTAASNTSDVGSYAINGSGLTANNGNYTFVQNAGNATALTITQRPVDITGTKVYDTTTSFAGNQLTAGNLVNGDTVTLGGSATVSSKNVATYTSFASNSLTSSNDNYMVTGGSVSVTITPATLTYNADPASMVYGNSVPSLSGTVTGFAGSDNLSNATTGTAAFNTAASNTSNVGSYAITGSGLTANNGNYTFTQAAGNASALTITQRPIDITGTKVYDTTTSFAGNQLTAGNLVNGDTVTLGGSATVSSKNVNTYTSFASNSLTSSNSNYAVTGGTVSVTITPATLAYNADAASMVYGNSVPSLSGTVTGFVGGETIGTATTGTAAFNTAASNTSNVGSYAINGSGLTANNGNYTFVQNAGNATALTITQRPVDITGTKVYDTTTSFAGNQLTAGNLVNGDTVTLGGSATVSSKNVATYTSFASNSLTSSNSNYMVTGGSVSVTITPATLSITGSRVYDATTAFAGTALTANGVAGESFALTGSGTASSANVQSNQALASLGTLALGTGSGGALSSNYTAISAVNTSVSITPHSLVFNAVTDTKTYDATTVSSGIVGTTGLQGSDTVTGLSQVFNSKNVLGTNNSILSVVGTGYTINDGNGGANYSVGASTTAAGTIDPAVLTVNNVTVNTKVYDATTAAVLDTSAATLSGVYSGDTVTLNTAGYTANFADKNVNNNIPVSVSGMSLAGASASNYTLTNTSANVSGNITPFALTNTATAQNKVYDATTNVVATLSVNTFAADSSVVASYNSVEFDTKSAGTGKSVTMTGIALNGVGASNYTYSTTATTVANITPATLTITGVAANSRPYNGSTAATLNTQSAVLHGIFSGDNVGLSGGGTGFFATANYGNNIPVTATSIQLNGVDMSNYVLTLPTGLTADITGGSSMPTVSDISNAIMPYYLNGNNPFYYTSTNSEGTVGTANASGSTYYFTAAGITITPASNEIEKVREEQGCYGSAGGTCMIQIGNVGLQASTTVTTGLENF